MESAASDGENPNQNEEVSNNHNKIGNSGDGPSKPKRQMKTPFQLETLEKAYASETYPNESTRVVLSEKLGLSDRQLQMWFCHRRLKDKKDVPPRKSRKVAAAVLPASPVDELRTGAEPGSDYGSGSGSGSGSSPFGHMEMRNVVPRAVGEEIPVMRRYYEPSHSMIEHKAVACVEAQLGEPLREDGPILGIEFDPLPPGAFGTPIEAAAAQQKRSGHSYEGRRYEQCDINKAPPRACHDYPFHDQVSARIDAYGQVGPSRLPDSVVEFPSAGTSSFFPGSEQLMRVHNFQGHLSRFRLLPQQDKTGVNISSPGRDDESIVPRDSFASIRLNGQFGNHTAMGQESPLVQPDGNIFHSDAVLRMERKHKNEEARTAREAEAHEMRMRKELQKQDNMRKKSEERMRKEIEKQDRERKKEEERLLRERQREEERMRREERRENEKRERILQKEHMKAEKRRQKEALRQEKEAVRRKAAIEKATARRIAKESMELIEDEQLELMELAASRKGLYSITGLDHDTLQNLDLFRDFLGDFPPNSVQLKKPLGIQPWTNSEENIGNLLMVWRFFITFADVLELWPFTLDEFVQALHDYDSRLLGEIHLSLLRLIIKDIEDVARTPSSGLGIYQNGASNPGGGHLQIVEGAYAWGFDIRNWQKHLNPLTWPEIFRQLALSTGFGPQLKKRNTAWSDLRENDEGKGCEDIISTLRNGSAAENAFAVMQEKGLLAPRRSRHRLTPGTVKFAAFHVLSLEGSKGLTVIELAEKIQKSGLRDLTTSKTPEASISVALTRDTKLFERIAPSTYRVRAPYRKDPIDAEEILSEARKKIQIFQNGFLAEEDAEDAERDEESESDEADEDPEVDDVGAPSLSDKIAGNGNEADTATGSGKENLCDDYLQSPLNEMDKDPHSFLSSASNEVKLSCSVPKQDAAIDEISVSNLDQDNMETDESKVGESWLQGLTEGEYCDLSVEERLNALVALTGIANEGNSIRIVLEDRLEAANALKKQMWAEAQLDKGRLKEENVNKSEFPSSMGSKAEAQAAYSTLEGGQSPVPDIDNKNSEALPTASEHQKSPNESQSLHNHLNNGPQEKPSFGHDLSTGPDFFLPQQLGNASKRSRSQLKSYIGHVAEEMYAYRSLPLGKDRRRNRYWQFVVSASSNDPGSGRIFVEFTDGRWRLIDSEEAFDALLMSLDPRGSRESHLRLMLQKIEMSFKENVRRNVRSSNLDTQSKTTVKNEADEMDLSPDCPISLDSPRSAVCGLNSEITVASSSFRIELGRNESEKRDALKRYHDYQRWAWKECFNPLTLCAMKHKTKRCQQLLDICDSCLSSYLIDYNHCLSCHQTFGTTVDDFDFSEHVIQCEEKRKLNHWDAHVFEPPLPVGRLLKAILAFIEAAIPAGAVESHWDEQRKTWGLKLDMSSSIEQLLQMLTLLESVMKRDFISSRFTTTEELLESGARPANSLQEPGEADSISTLPWIPRTAAAVALRLFELDASISYVPSEKPEPGLDKEGREYMKLPSRYAPGKNDRENDQTPYNDETVKDKNRAGLKNGRNSYRSGRGSREQGRRRRIGRANGPRLSAARKRARGNEKMHRGLRQLGQGLNVQGGRGRRTVRRRRVEKGAAGETLLGQTEDLHTSNRNESPDEFSREWDDEKINTPDLRNDDDINNMEVMESDDDGQAVGYEQENWEIGASNQWNGDPMGASDEDEDASEDDNGNEEMGDEDNGNEEMGDEDNRNEEMGDEDDGNEDIGDEDNGNEDIGDDDNGNEEMVDEDSAGDVDMSQDSDGVGNRVENDEGSESDVSEDYSD